MAVNNKFKKIGFPECTSALILLIAVVNICFPGHIGLTGLYTSQGMPVLFQVIWTLLALAFIWLLKRTETVRIPGSWLLWLTAVMVCLSFYFFRIEYASMILDGERGGTPIDMNLMIFTTHENHIGRQIPDYLNVTLARYLPDSLCVDYKLPVLLRNTRFDSACIYMAMIIGSVVVLLSTFAVSRLKIPLSEKLGLLIISLTGAHMSNAYGICDGYTIVVLSALFLFIVLWRFGYGLLNKVDYVLMVPLIFYWGFAHPFSWIFPGFPVLLLMLAWGYKKWNISCPLWLILAGSFILTCFPLFTYALNLDAIVEQYTQEHVGEYILDNFMQVLQCNMSAVVLAIMVFISDRNVLRKPTPLQQVLLVIFFAYIGYYFQPIFHDPAIIHIPNGGIYSSMVFGASILLYLTSRADRKIVFYCAVLAIYMAVPSIYVYSNRLFYERAVALTVQDRSHSHSRSLSPYVYLGLYTPVDTKEDRDARLELFRKGVETDEPMYQQYKGLNMIFYIAWCFEFGEVDAGARALSSVFGNPQILRDLWMNGTRFTDRYQNVAYKRIRYMSRQIINQQLQRDPNDNYMKQLSSLLDQYEIHNP